MGVVGRVPGALGSDTGTPCKLWISDVGAEWWGNSVRGHTRSPSCMASGTHRPLRRMTHLKGRVTVPVSGRHLGVSFVRRRFIGVRKVAIATRPSQVHSMHLSDRITGAGGGTGRHDAVHFGAIVCREHNLRIIGDSRLFGNSIPRRLARPSIATGCRRGSARRPRPGSASTPRRARWRRPRRP